MPYAVLPRRPGRPIPGRSVIAAGSGAGQFGRLLEREADNSGGVEFTWRGALDYVTKPRGVISVGPWGGSGGQPFYMRGASAPRLRSIVLYHSGAIHSLACDYTLAGDHEGPSPRVAGPWDLPHSYGSRGVRTEIDLPSGEHITAVEGTTGHFANVLGVVITSLTFRTSSGRTYGPYGSVAGRSHYFSVPVADGACIVGFWGRSGWLLDAIGVYMKPSCSSSSSDTATPASKKVKAVAGVPAA
ncbi:salt stress-induced protein-like isoform X4 [Miscanthus floridulus]|uniref:salt stress-induced protein-like isoform X4 n=1 Tax=Miscanthus floridulus TaxID=154761 RepID=UPI0034594A7E